MVNTSINKVDSNVTVTYAKQAVEILKQLKDSEPNLFKMPRDNFKKGGGMSADSAIVRFNFLSKTYLLKFFPDVWANIASYTNSLATINRINKTDRVAQIKTSFVLPVASNAGFKQMRVVLSEFEPGKTLAQVLHKMTSTDKKALDKQIRDLCAVFAKEHLFCYFNDIDNFLIRKKDGKLILLDWDALKPTLKTLPVNDLFEMNLSQAENCGPLSPGKQAQLQGR